MSGAAPAQEVDLLDSDLQAFAWLHPYSDQRRRERIVERRPDGWVMQAHERREIYAFNAPEIGIVTFDVRGIKDALVARAIPFKMIEADLTPSWVEHIRANSGVEAFRMAGLTPADLVRPGIAVQWPGAGYTTMIDGNNRLVRNYDVGAKTFRFACIQTVDLPTRYVCLPGNEEKFFLTPEDRDLELLAKRVRVV